MTDDVDKIHLVELPSFEVSKKKIKTYNFIKHFSEKKSAQVSPLFLVKSCIVFIHYNDLRSIAL